MELIQHKQYKKYTRFVEFLELYFQNEYLLYFNIDSNLFKKLQKCYTSNGIFFNDLYKMEIFRIINSKDSIYCIVCNIYIDNIKNNVYNHMITNRHYYNLRYIYRINNKQKKINKNIIYRIEV